MVGKVLVGLLVAAGLFLVYTLLFSGEANAVGASTGSGMGSPRPLDKSGTFAGGSTPKVGNNFTPGSLFDKVSKGQIPFQVTYQTKTRTW